MSENNEKIFDSPASDPEDEFWLAHGKQIIIESLPAVRSAANSVITALGFIQAIYLGMLGFGEFIPQEIPWNLKALFFIPLLFWLLSLYCCINVVMTGKMKIVLYSPEDIKDKSLKFTLKKQCALRWGFIFMAAGLLAAFVLFVIRLRF
jgi:hypothetical protein